MITPSKKAKVFLEVAMLLSEEGLDKITDLPTLLSYKSRLVYLRSKRTFKQCFGNWGSMVSTLRKRHPDLIQLAETPKSKPEPKTAPKVAPKPKAAAKPAVKKPAVKQGK